LISSTTTRQPRWTEQDRAEIFALLLYRERPCPCGCGQPAELTLQPEAEGPGWLVDQITCTARLALLEAQRAAVGTRGTENAAARLWRIQPRGR
jgi:hypothetical protein